MRTGPTVSSHPHSHPFLCKLCLTLIVLTNFLLTNDCLTIGIIMNDRRNSSMVSHMENLPPEFAKLFGLKTVNWGGAVARLNCVHHSKDCGGVIVPNCKKPTFHAMRDIEASLKYLSSNKKEIDEFQFFVGSCVWSEGDLEKQVNEGFWLPVESTPDVMLELIRNLDKELLRGARRGKIYCFSVVPANYLFTSCAHQILLQNDEEHCSPSQKIPWR